MRYPKDHKDASRQRLVALGGSHAKKHGFSQSAVAELAASAGMTTGAMYKHFDGKADLFLALIRSELDRTAAMYGAIDPDDEASVARAIRGYLSIGHLQHPEKGCVLPSLTPEIARADEDVRAAYQSGLLEIHARFQAFTGNAQTAWTLMAQNVGAVMLARALPDEGLQKEILAALRKAGENLVTGNGRRAGERSATKGRAAAL